MRTGVRRGIALLACGMLRALLPTAQQGWGRAVRREVAGIADDSEALRFALSSLCGLAPQAIAFHLARALAIVAGDEARPTGGMTDMSFDDAVRRPRAIGIACAIGAAMLGIVYMAMADAPMRYLAINAGALAIGLGLVAAIGRTMSGSGRHGGMATLAMALVLLGIALFGDRVEGAARWVRVGALYVQPSLVLLPVMIVGFARARTLLATIGMAVAALALAIQPDRAMAGMLAAGLAVLTVMRPDRFVLPAFASAIAGFAVTLVRVDTLPAVPYVDQILYSAFDVHMLAGVAVLGGSVLLIVPAIVGRLYDVDNREAYAVFGIAWLSAILAAALGNYPTPMVGYGGSAVIGYVLSLTMLPKVARSCLGVEIVLRDEDREARRPERYLCVGLAYSA